jgi:hypothetical protein
MRFDNLIRGSAIGRTGLGLQTVGTTLILVCYFMFFGAALLAQKPPDSSDLPEMIATEQGFLAINTPRGWERSDGPGLAFFVPKTKSKEPSPVWIYIGSAPIGPSEGAKDLKSYVESDITEFKKTFKSGLVQAEPTLSLPYAKLQAVVYTFRSGEKHNTVERVAYIGESNRVLTLVLSARTDPAFERALPVFREFAESYRGSITPTSGSIDFSSLPSPRSSKRSHAI